VAVSKKFSARAIREAYQAGLREFGENYVQEFAQKNPELEDLKDARFHLIGHLQSNKARDASALFQVIHTVDSPKLLRRLEMFAAGGEKQIDVLIEVKLSEELSKTGARPEGIPELLDVAQRCPHLCMKGLMTIPPWSEDAERSRPYFRRLAQLGRQYGLKDLSMGMSGDFEVAIEEGATIIRVGTAIFGPRTQVETHADL
jgi:pyridoxal phosphate enzyme (YggS family)